MTNTEKFNKSYSDLVDILSGLTGALSEVTNTKNITEDDSKLLSNLVNTLYTMGKTSILEENIENAVDQNITKKEVNKDVNESRNV